MKNNIYTPFFLLSICLASCFLCLNITKANAQVFPEIIDTTKMVFESNEVILFYTDLDGSPNPTPYHKAKYIDFDTATAMQFFDSTDLATGYKSSTNFGQTAAVGNYFGDQKDEVKYAYVISPTQYKICGFSVDYPGDTFSIAPNCDSVIGVIRRNDMIAVGANITGDSYDEFVLGLGNNYLSNNPLGSFTIVSGAANYVETNVETGQDANNRLAKGDFNGDGVDEIVYLGIKILNGVRSPFIRVLSNNLSIVSPPLYLDTVGYTLLMSLRVADVTGDGKDDIVFAFGGGTDPTGNTFMGIVEVNTNLTTFIYNQANNLVEYRDDQNSSKPYSLAIDVADLNFDGTSEMVLGAGKGSTSKIGVYQLNASVPTLISNQISYEMDDERASANWLVAGDFNPINNDLSIMVLEYTRASQGANNGFDHTFTTKVYDIDPSGFNITLNNSDTSMVNTNDQNRYFDLLKLDADNDKIKLGKGTYYSVTEYGQPVAVLNVPPIHFDIVGGDTLDLNSCQNNQLCKVTINYTTSNSSNTVFTSQSKGTYGFSNSLTASAKFGALEIKKKVETKAATSLSNLVSSGKSFTSTVSVDLTHEGDHVYSLVSDYHVWEYPVYIDGEYQGNFITVQPDSNTANMVYTEGRALNNYHFDHEPSNLLSYKNYTLPMSQNANAQDSFYVAAPTTINSNSSITNSWEFGSELSSAASKSKEKSLAVSGSVSLKPKIDFFGVEVGVGMSAEIGRSYSNSQMSTVSSTLSNSFSVSVNPGRISQYSVSTRSYKVQPYLYYDTKGVLYVDYAVTFHPETQTGTTTSSWFYDKYGRTTAPKQDPAFILPFRLNDEKGYGPINEIDKDKTSSIQMWPRNPSPGDTVLIGANVHNLSLGPNPSDPVEILFYAESIHPSTGHCKIELLSIDSGTAGRNLFNLGPIAPRESAQVNYRCIFPSGLGTFPRIYGVIDPHNKIPNEIQERNNKGFFSAGPFLQLSVPQKDSTKYYSGTVYVDASATSSNQKGDSWANALTQLSDVLNPYNTSFPDTVLVAQGTYKPSGADLCSLRKNYFFIPDSVVVLGGYPTSGGQRDFKNNMTILSGEILSPSDTDNCYTVLLTNSKNAIIDGFTIEGGNANADAQMSGIPWNRESAGGGLYIDGDGNWGNANPQINNCIFRNNKATQGGAVFVNGQNYGTSKPNFLNCTFYNNKAIDGAAIMATAENYGTLNPKVYQCLFYDNIASSQGGAIYNESKSNGLSNLDIRQSTFVQNDGNSNSIYQNNSGAVAHIKNSIVWGNVSNNSSSAITDSNNIIMVTNVPYPDFVDSANNNFRLTLCSPAQNAGLLNFIPNGTLQDLDGENRIQNSNPELGVYEGAEIPRLIQSQTNNNMIATHEHTDSLGWTHYCTCDNSAANNDAWMLSIKKNGNNIGQISDTAFVVSTATTNLYGTNIATDLSAAAYVATDSFFAFNRYWQVTPTTQPSSPVHIRFPYSNTDFLDLQGSQPLLQNHTDMAFFKIDGAYNPHSLSVPSTAYNNYTHGPTANTLNWNYTNYSALIPNTHVAEYVVSSFSGGGGGFGNGLNNGPLPVEYVNFSVTQKSNSNLLLWTTVNEKNNSHFNIQHSETGNNFSVLGRVNSKVAGTTNQQKSNYSFEDLNPQIGHNYYRLEQLDMDGKKKYSKIIDIILTKERQVLNLYPNPTKETLYLDYYSEEENLLELKVVDLNGRVVKSIRSELREGDNHLEISTSKLPNALYNIQIRVGDEIVYAGKIEKN